MTWVLVASTVATWGMVGLIWMVQIVHYPMLVHYSAAVPGTAARDHANRISFVVGPLMAVEGVTALMLLGWRPDAIGWFSAWLAAALLGVALLSTVLVQVPLHTRLGQGHDADAAARLLRTNWVRTVAWTGRGVVLAVALAA